MIKIILTGPESTGKTTLCKKLSEHFKFPYINEYARKYIDGLHKDYTQRDLTKIAQQQLILEQNNSKVLFCDTDLITIKIWSMYKYKNCDSWIINKILQQKRERRFYILCNPDIAWEKDPQRENPNNREEIFNLYHKELKDLNHNYYIAKGENRDEDSIKIISDLIKSI